VTPNSGNGANQVFTAVYSDVLGYQDISQAMFMVDGNATGASGCVVLWQQSSNAFYLANDAGSALMGPITGSSSGTLQNSQCTLNGATSSGGGSGNTLTVNVGLSFKAAFTGTKNTYLLAYGSDGNSGWQIEGTWNNPGAPQPPTNVSVTPNSGSRANQVFTATYSDVLGYQDISQAMFMVAGNPSGVSGCAVMWEQSSNAFYLANDTANTWMGPITGGSSGTLQNSQCTLNGATSSGGGQGNTLTVNVGLSFKAAFTGTENTYLLSYGSAGNSGWQLEGVWIP
jgi:hypothetical protein